MQIINLAQSVKVLVKLLTVNNKNSPNIINTRLKAVVYF